MKKNEEAEAITGSKNQHKAICIFPWNCFKKENKLLKEVKLRKNSQKMIKP
ncbi:hypothetical protein MP478_00650 [Chryseobacterium sp. WG14]|uniref:hypothetical protein n=1 Tax=unclassified Chryseobacterium TaxID=2593645 RepID=UPI00211DEC5C|nr:MULTISPECIES: hypothetical protein [unclassified Chryseobacterium]MCQ9635725.1 hypothetical protein [Chryseobacterium sp. WG23]MCQ9637879.1 hypothetical protein [Chryseobacterium sp. WG14]